MPSRDKKKVAALLLAILLRRRQRKKRIWSYEWLKKRHALGSDLLFDDLSSEDLNSYQNFIRMNEEDFNFLLERVDPLIRKKDTNFRQSIQPKTRLCLTLHYLATGDTFETHKYLFRIGLTTICGIIAETAKAIYKVLKPEYMKVSIFF